MKTIEKFTKKHEYRKFGIEWEKEMQKIPKSELINMLRAQCKLNTISTIDDAERFCEGTLNDFESGVSTKSETLKALGNYTGRLMSLFWENAKKQIKEDPSLLD